MAGGVGGEIDMQAVYQRLQDIQPENIDVTSHFSAAELSDMPDIEKNRYRSIKLNYLVMLEFGIPANLPEFMRKKRKPRCPPPTVPSDSDSDEDWKPKKAKPKGTNWRPPPVKCPKIQKTRERPSKKPSAEKTTKRKGKKKADDKTTEKSTKQKPSNKVATANSDDEEFMGFTEADLTDYESFIDCRIKSLTEAISKLDTDDDSLTLAALEALEPTVLRGTPAPKPQEKNNETQPAVEEKSTPEKQHTENTETPKSPGSALLPLFGCSLSQSSNPEIADLFNEDALDIAEVDPKSWDNLLEGLGTMSPGLSRVATPVNNGENVAENLDQEALVKECYSHLQSQPAGKILELVPSQSDSGLGDTSLVSGSDVESPGLSESNVETHSEKKDTLDAENLDLKDNEQNNTKKCGEKKDKLDTENPGLNDNEENCAEQCSEERDTLESEKSGRYPKRSMGRVNYKDVEVPEEDEFIWCEDCDQEYKGDCPVCGPLIIVEDTPVSQGDPNYASKTIPDRLYIDQSSILGAGTGVYAKSKIQKGVRFGPYQGQCVLNEEEAHNSGYSWEIQRRGKTSHFVDARAESASNWMRYVNCARNSNEQNLLAFQYCGRIYYRTLREVFPREELLVWYGDAYGEELGLSTITDDLIKCWNQELQGFHCPQPGCTMMYTDSDRLIVHLLLRHKIIVRQTWFHCLYCRYSSNTETRLKEHIKCCRNKPENTNDVLDYNSNKCVNKYMCTDKYMCTEDKAYLHKCHICGKGFTSDGNLRNHVRVHTGDRPYRCSVCDKGFTQLNNMHRHMRIHTQEKKYKCQFCSKGFTDKSNLRKHVRTHTGEKRYKCDQCGMGFTQNGHLKTHMRIHTGDRPYKCHICGRSYTQNGHLIAHKRTYHANKLLSG